MARFTAYAALSMLAAGSMVYHAQKTRVQFYPTVVYLTTSKFSIALLGNLLLVLTAAFGKFLSALYFGRISSGEWERVGEQLPYTVIKTALTLTIFREEINVRMAAMFTAFLFISVFHWLGRARLDTLEAQEQSQWLKTLRIGFLYASLTVWDSLLVAFCTLQCFTDAGFDPSIFVLFAFEFAALLVEAGALNLRFLLYILETRVGEWADKPLHLFYVEILSDVARLMLYLTFFSVVFVFYGMPLYLIRDLYVAFRDLVRRVSHLIQYRRIASDLHQRFPSIGSRPAEGEDGSGEDEDVCIVCRDALTAEDKRLPCNHVFHFHCLRSWLATHTTCPICRFELQPFLEGDPQVAARRVRQELRRTGHPVATPGEEEGAGHARPQAEQEPEQGQRQEQGGAAPLPEEQVAGVEGQDQPFAALVAGVRRRQQQQAQQQQQPQPQQQEPGPAGGQQDGERPLANLVRDIDVAAQQLEAAIAAHRERGAAGQAQQGAAAGQQQQPRDQQQQEDEGRAEGGAPTSAAAPTTRRAGRVLSDAQATPSAHPARSPQDERRRLMALAAEARSRTLSPTASAAPQPPPAAAAAGAAQSGAAPQPPPSLHFSEAPSSAGHGAGQAPYSGHMPDAQALAAAAAAQAGPAGHGPQPAVGASSPYSSAWPQWQSPGVPSPWFSAHAHPHPAASFAPPPGMFPPAAMAAPPFAPWGQPMGPPWGGGWWGAHPGAVPPYTPPMHAPLSSPQGMPAAGAPTGSPQRWAGDDLSRREMELAARIGQLEQQLAELDRAPAEAPAEAEHRYGHGQGSQPRPTAFTGADAAVPSPTQQRQQQWQQQRQRSPQGKPSVAARVPPLAAAGAAADRDESDAGSGYLAASSSPMRLGDTTGRADDAIVGNRGGVPGELPSPQDRARSRPGNPAAPPPRSETHTPAQLDTPELTATPLQRGGGEAGASPGLQSLPPPADQALPSERARGRREGDEGAANS